MWARHLGWLHATPKGAKKSRGETYKEADENHFRLEMPDIEEHYGAGYIPPLLLEAGLMSSNGMGPISLSWQEIDSWLRTCERSLSVWERTVIKQMSDEYVRERLLAEEPNRPAPFTPAPEDIDREQVSNKIYSVLSRLMAAGKQAQQNSTE